jgi:hypothetical protein
MRKNLNIKCKGFTCMIKKSKGKKAEPRIRIVEIWEEFINVEPHTIQLSQIFLDPNNPRLQTPDKPKISDNRIGEQRIQDSCLKELREEGIKDLTESIRNSGFWTVDRIVLRPLKDDKFVVIEGNRRIAALKTLEESHSKGRVTLPAKVYEGIEKFEALVYRGNSPDISWIIQGFRHSPGIMSWDAYPQAMFLAKFEKERKKSPTEIASILGYKTPTVTHLMRSYYGFEDAKKDKEYGDGLSPEKFGHFSEIIFERESLQLWLGWDDTKREFTNKKNLKLYLKWATTPFEDTKKPRIDVSPTTRDVLSQIVLNKNQKILEKFENGKIRDLTEAKEELNKEEERRAPIDIQTIIEEFTYAKKVAEVLPIPRLQLVREGEDKTQKENLLKIMEDLKKILELQIENLRQS